MQYLLEEIQKIRGRMAEETGGEDPVEHCLARIKSEESMREKCRRKGLPETEKSALEDIHDAIGIRIVCSFLSDVYTIRDGLAGLPGCEVTQEKDYIRHAKPNGYRSYHMILMVTRNGKHCYAEIQLRTISQDTWAALEHHQEAGRRGRRPHQRGAQALRRRARLDGSVDADDPGHDCRHGKGDKTR